MASAERPRRWRRQRGFTLLEMLVAFTILVMAFSVVLRVFSAGARSTGFADRHSRAVAHAEALLERYAAEEPLAAQERGGRLEQDLQWQVTVEPYPVESGPLEPQTEAALYRIAVTVSWPGPQERRRVRLETLRLAGAPPLGAG